MFIYIIIYIIIMLDDIKGLKNGMANLHNGYFHKNFIILNELIILRSTGNYSTPVYISKTGKVRSNDIGR